MDIKSIHILYKAELELHGSDFLNHETLASRGVARGSVFTTLAHIHVVQFTLNIVCKTNVCFKCCHVCGYEKPF